MNITEFDENKQQEIAENKTETRLTVKDGLKVEDYYEGFIINVAGDENDDLAILSSSACAIGGRLSLRFGDTPDDVEVFTRGQQRVCNLNPDDAKRISKIKSRGWVIDIVPILVMYQQRGKVFTGEFAVMAYNDRNVEVADCIKVFIRNMLKRIKGGDHPHVSLSQKQFDQVISSKGKWYMTREAPMPKKQKGYAVFKRRQSGAEFLQDLSYDHKVGCSILSWVFIAIVAALLIWLIFIR